MNQPMTETVQDAIETLHDHVEEARKLHGADYGAARDCVMERIKGHRYIIREAAMVGIMTLLYRNQNNIQRLLKGKDPAFISPMPGHCIRGKEAISAASVALDDWIVSYSGKLLFDSTREDLAAAADWHKSRACGEIETANFYAALRDKTKPGKTVRECMKREDVRRIRDNIFGG